MSTPPFDAEAHARATAAAIGLPILPHQMPGIVAGLRVAAAAAALIEQVALDPADEPAPVFVAAPRA
jgi:hypothetical protein